MLSEPASTRIILYRFQFKGVGSKVSAFCTLAPTMNSFSIIPLK